MNSMWVAESKTGYKKFYKAASFMVALVLLSVVPLSVVTAFAAKDDYDINVKVAFPIIKAMSEVDSLGNPKGYNIQYLQDIATYSNFTYKYYMESYDRCIEKLKTGELDMIGYVYKSPEKEQFLDYTTFPAGNLECMLVTDEYSSRFMYNDYTTLQNARVGMLRNNIYESKLKEMQQTNGITLNIYKYDSESTLKLDLSLGKIDCVLLSNYDNLAGYSVIFDLGSMPFYFAVSKKCQNHDQIFTKLEQASKTLLRKFPNYNEKIALGYKESRPSQIVNLTEEEKEYIRGNGKIKVAYSLDWVPMSFYDFINHYHQGFIFELMNELTKSTGIEFEYVLYKTYNEALEAVQNGQADVIGGCDKEIIADCENSIVLSQPYVNMRTVAVYNPNSYDAPVAVPNTYFSAYQIKSLSLGKHVEMYDTVEECLKKVNEGQASYTYLNKYAY